jgi:pimeloyl-ACP methyl ester carboxylesterase
VAVGRAEDRLEPLARLVRFEATDGLRLAGLLYEPRRRTRRAIVWLHGTGGASVFESKRTNVLGRELTRRGFAFFPFNNRGAHIVTRAGGMAYERIRDAVPDIEGALRELRRRGFHDITLAGHSTGANKIAVYDRYKPRNRVKRYILLAGGDDTGLLHAQLGARRFEAALTKARAMIRSRRGDEIVPKAIAPLMLSWRAFLDTANPAGDYNVFPFAGIGRFRHARRIRKPALYLYGECDEYIDDLDQAMAKLAANIGPRGEIVVMEGADHGFSDLEREVAAVICDWIELAVAANS